MSEIRITLVNHASILIEYKSIKLLTDPWYQGSCFEDGWGLLYNNKDAYKIAKNATHLWVSHFHGDHFHIETLQKIHKENPNIIAYGNRSYNFKIDDALRRIGFENVVSLPEKKQLVVNNDFSMERIPTTGIDNMLVIRTDEGTILNYNDCNIPLRTRKHMAKTIGKVDVMLNNFNHAGKVMAFPFPETTQIKEEQKAFFLNNITPFKPTYVIPFASYHYYKAAESVKQNNSLLGLNDLLPLQQNILNIPIGSSICFTNKFAKNKVITNYESIEKNAIKTSTHVNQYSLEALQQAALNYKQKLRKGFWVFANWLPSLQILVSDLDMVITLNVKNGVFKAAAGTECHIVSHSEAIYKWFTQPFGTDNFIVGAHFEITKHEMPLKWQTLFGLLTENRLDLISIIKMFFSVKGLRFLWNRKNEIISIIFSKKLIASEQRK
jgi:UDP-MurNAc hydroxylase